MALDKNDLISLVATNKPDNTTGLITPAKSREVDEQIITANANLEESTNQTFLGPVTFNGGVLGLSGGVFVAQLSDFPAPVSGVITLASNTLYTITSIIDIGANTIAYGGNSELRGLNSSISGISSTSVNPLIACDNQLMRISMITLTNPGGDLFDFTGSASASFIMSQVVSFSYQNIGTFHNTGSGTMNTCAFFGGVNGILFTGTGAGQWIIQATGFSGFSGKALDFGAAVFQTISIATTAFTGLGGSTSITGLAASGNISTRASIGGCTFNGAGTPLSGISNDDIKYTFVGNFGVQDTKEDALISLNDNATETVITTIDTPVLTAGTWVVERESFFTCTTGGRCTYVGEKDLVVPVDISATIASASGTNKDIHVYLALNGTVIPNSGKQARVSSTDSANIGIVWQLELTTNDYLEMFVENNADTINLVASDAVIRIR